MFPYISEKIFMYFKEEINKIERRIQKYENEIKIEILK
jgi:hypothetical protein